VLSGVEAVERTQRAWDGADEPSNLLVLEDEDGAHAADEAVREDAQEDAQSDDEPEDDPVLLPISGWVFDQDGAPVNQIEVAATARRLAEGRDAAGFGGRAESALTDKEGYFAFEELPDGEYLLETEATDDYDSARTMVRSGVTSVTLIVRGGEASPVTIHGLVTDDQGGPIAGALVAPTDEAQGTTTDGGGAYRLVLTVDDRPRTRSIRFTKAGYHPQILGVPQSELQDTTAHRLDAQLDEIGGGVPFYGTVMAEDGRPVAQARVQLSSRSLQRSYQAFTASDGSFTIDDAEVGGGYRLWVRPKADYQDYLEWGLQVAPGGLSLTVLLEPLGTGSLRGRMIDGFGLPVPSFTLWMWNSAPGADRSLPVTGDRDGRFRVDQVPAGEVTFGSQGDPQFSIGVVQLEPGTTVEAELMLDWGDEQLAGLVLDSGGEPVSGAEVKLLWWGQAQDVLSRSKRRTVTDGSGYFLFSKLGPGAHTIVVSARGYRAVQREAMPTMPGGEVVIQLQETTS
jgi:protocatechuate 3,4-dioxygenase beta subunit